MDVFTDILTDSQLKKYSNVVKFLFKNVNHKYSLEQLDEELQFGAQLKRFPKEFFEILAKLTGNQGYGLKIEKKQRAFDGKIEIRLWCSTLKFSSVEELKKTLYSPSWVRKGASKIGTNTKIITQDDKSEKIICDAILERQVYYVLNDPDNNRLRHVAQTDFIGENMDQYSSNYVGQAKFIKWQNDVGIRIIKCIKETARLVKERYPEEDSGTYEPVGIPLILDYKDTLKIRFKRIDSFNGIENNMPVDLVLKINSADPSSSHLISIENGKNKFRFNKNFDEQEIVIKRDKYKGARYRLGFIVETPFTLTCTNSFYVPIEVTKGFIYTNKINKKNIEGQNQIETQDINQLDQSSGNTGGVVLFKRDLKLHYEIPKQYKNKFVTKSEKKTKNNLGDESKATLEENQWMWDPSPQLQGQQETALPNGDEIHDLLSANLYSFINFQTNYSQEKLKSDKKDSFFEEEKKKASKRNRKGLSNVHLLNLGMDLWKL